ncbi:MAG: hypothetical protein NTW19_02555 [Planctomycetota bacterium]|nr:hypothetical protein [Planctomycetota bacterium]
MSHKRKCCCLPACPPAIELTLAGVDGSSPCVDTVVGLSVSCSSPLHCVTGVSTAVDGVYRVPRSLGPTSDGWCEFRGEFDAATSFDQRTASSVFLGVPTCVGGTTRRAGSRIRVYVRFNRGLLREVCIWSIENGLAAVPVSFYNGFLLFNTFGDTLAFDDCHAPTCGRLMSGGAFTIRKSH